MDAVGFKPTIKKKEFLCTSRRLKLWVLIKGGGG